MTWLTLGSLRGNLVRLRIAFGSRREFRRLTLNFSFVRTGSMDYRNRQSIDPMSSRRMDR